MDTKNRILIIVFVLLFIGIISADTTFRLGRGDQKYDLGLKYGQGENIQGWINISFENQTSDSIFESSIGDIITLGEVLRSSLNKNYKTDCLPEDCNSFFITTSELTSPLSLEAGEEIVLGIKLEETIDPTKDFKLNLNLTSDSSDSCKNQIEIDILNDGIIDFKNKNSSKTICSGTKNTGCYSSTKGELQPLGDTAFSCQRILFKEAPSVILGGKVTGSGEINFKLLDLSLKNLGDCTYSSNGKTLTEEDAFCEVKYNVPSEQEYYLCAQTNTGDIKIKRYEEQNACGFYKIPASSSSINENLAYNLYGKSMMFGGFSLNIDNEEVNKNISKYIISHYGSNGACLDSQTGSCIIPIRIKSNVAQELTLSDIKFKYFSSSGAPGEKNKLYNLKEIPAKITSKYQKLFLDNSGLKVPTKIGAKRNFKIYFNNQIIFDEDLIILKSASIDGLIPQKTAALVPTEFIVFLNQDSNSNITKYEWDFGDGNKTQSTSGIVEYTYSSVGTYDLTIKLTDSLGITSSKTFQIRVNSPKDAISETLTEKLADISNFKLELEKLDELELTTIKDSLNTSKIESELNSLKTEYDKVGNSGTDKEYLTLMSNLINLKVPKSFEIKEVADLTFYPEKRDIDLEKIQLASIGKTESLNDTEAYKNEILVWNQNNINANLKVSEVLVNYGTAREKISTIYNLNIGEKSSREDSFLIIKNLENLNFKGDYSEKDLEGYFSIPLTNSRKTISFSTSESLTLSELPIMISPALSALSVVSLEADAPDEPNTKLWIIFGIIIFGLIILAFVGYVFLAKWYKDKYEDYLFPNKNDLINMVSFVQDGKKKGLDNTQIRKNLKSASWNSEQINYVMRKYEGKRTGLFEISFFKKKLEESHTKIPPVKTPPKFNNFNPNQRRGFIPR